MYKHKSKDGMYYINVKGMRYQYSQGRIWGRRLAKYIILRRDGFACVKCYSKKYLTIDRIRTPDEIIPHQKLLNHYDPSKCQTLCVSCHIETENFRENKMKKTNCKCQKNLDICRCNPSPANFQMAHLPKENPLEETPIQIGGQDEIKNITRCIDCFEEDI